MYSKYGRILVAYNTTVHNGNNCISKNKILQKTCTSTETGREEKTKTVTLLAQGQTESLQPSTQEHKNQGARCHFGKCEVGDRSENFVLLPIYNTVSYLESNSVD
jgi:hypothetical protein